MKVFEQRDDKGSLCYFEVRSLWPRWVVYRVIRRIPSVEIVKPLRHFVAENQDVFCTFKVKDTMLEVEEPWGDSSRYEVRPIPLGPSADLELVRDHFRAFTPWPFSAPSERAFKGQILFRASLQA